MFSSMTDSRYDLYTEALEWMLHYKAEKHKELELTGNDIGHIAAFTKDRFPRNIIWDMVSTGDGTSEPHMRLMSEAEETEHRLSVKYAKTAIQVDERLDRYFAHEMVESSLTNLDKFIMSMMPQVSLFYIHPILSS